MKRKLFKTRYLKYLVAFLIPLVCVMIAVNWIDNDSWFVLAEGKQLVEGGIHYTDMLSMHSDFNIVVQNYGFAMIFYWVHEWFSATGIYILLLVLDGVVCWLIYKICMLISNKNENLSLLIMIATDIMLIICSFITTRAQMVSYILFLTLIYILELYVKTGKVKYLWWIPFLSLIQINMHASLWWMLFLVLLVYIIDSIKAPKLHLQGYKTKTLLIFGVIGMVVGLINPYGLKMITYIFTSYGSTTIANLVIEMHPFSLYSLANICLYLVIAVVLVLYIFGKKNRIRVRYLLMFFGFLALGLNSIKGMSQFILTMLFPIALLYSDFRVEKIFDSKFVRRAMVVWSGVLVGGMIIVLLIYIPGQVDDNPRQNLVEAVDAIDEAVGYEKEKSDLKIYAGYNDGGYLEYRGYKPYIDPRAEVFLKKNNGKEDIIDEYLNVLNGRVGIDEFMEKYDFDYLVVASSEATIYDYLMNKDKELSVGGINYKMIYADEASEIMVYEKA